MSARRGLQSQRQGTVRNGADGDRNRTTRFDHRPSVAKNGEMLWRADILGLDMDDDTVERNQRPDDGGPSDSAA